MQPVVRYPAGYIERSQCLRDTLRDAFDDVRPSRVSVVAPKEVVHATLPFMYPDDDLNGEVWTLGVEREASSPPPPPPPVEHWSYRHMPREGGIVGVTSQGVVGCVPYC